MDIVAVTTLLSSFLPSLLKLGDKAVESVGSAVGKDGWETAKKIWEKIHPKVAENPPVLKAAKVVVEDPDDEDFKKVFQDKLQKLIEQNPDLIEAIAKILEESAPLAPSVQINQTVANNEGQVIGQMTGGKAIGRIDGNIQGGVNL
jgi:hypothetical protein